MSISIGNELKDSFKIVDNWVSNGVEWLGDAEEFYRERAALEKEYLTKLRDLCKRHFDKKAKALAAVSVGDLPQITPGSLECALMVVWNDFLTQTEQVAEEHKLLANELLTKVADNLATLKVKSGNIVRQVQALNEYLVTDKQRSEDEVTKAKKQYDTLCQHAELARSKTERLALDRAQSKYHDKEIEMNIGKNDYLIKLAIANRLKDKYYFQDVPEVVDYLQELNEDRVRLVNKLLKNAGIIERNLLDRVKNHLHTIDGTIDQNAPELDTQMFVKHNQASWREPADFVFIPCLFWHADETVVTDEGELPDLKKRLNYGVVGYPDVESACLEAKQTLEELTAARKKTAGDQITLNFDSALSQLLQVLLRFMKADAARVRSEVEIEVIQNYCGDMDMTYHEEAPQKKKLFGIIKRPTKAAGDEDDQASVALGPVRVPTFKSSFSLRRKDTGASLASSGGGLGTALYQYVASDADEVSIEAGQLFTLVEADEGSGWTRITVDGQTGLVPTSYLQISAPAPASEAGGSRKGPAVAPKRGAKRVQYLEALYDYDADGDDEISIRAGDKIVLVQDDTDGSGWTEGELNNQRGMFPTLYVRKL